jgi:hypothetical protein
MIDKVDLNMDYVRSSYSNLWERISESNYNQIDWDIHCRSQNICEEFIIAEFHEAPLLK